MDIINKKLPTTCPSCKAELSVKRLSCSSCGTEVEGSYNMPLLMKLDEEEQEFILKFVLASGSLKEMAEWMKRSYPSVRNKLDEIIQKLKPAIND